MGYRSICQDVCHFYSSYYSGISSLTTTVSSKYLLPFRLLQNLDWNLLLTKKKGRTVELRQTSTKRLFKTFENDNEELRDKFISLDSLDHGDIQTVTSLRDKVVLVILLTFIVFVSQTTLRDP